MPRYLVMNRRGLQEPAKDALDAVSREPGVSVIHSEDPRSVTIEADERVAERLRTTLRDTHYVEPEIRRSLQ